MESNCRDENKLRKKTKCQNDGDRGAGRQALAYGKVGQIGAGIFLFAISFMP